MVNILELIANNHGKATCSH